MKRLRLILGASLLAAPWAFSQSPVPAAEEILKFSLEETREQIASVLGQPAQIADASPDYFTWYYQIGVSDNHEHSHLLLFSKKDGKLIALPAISNRRRNLTAHSQRKRRRLTSGHQRPSAPGA